ncbi:MAG: SsrA-binding protein, partial [Chloroflexota bacterium]
KMDVRDAFVLIRQGNAWLINAYIPQYEMATGFNKISEERRERLLLLHRREISNITKGIEQKGFTAIATKVYLKRGRAKVEIALARGKKNYDKRESIAKRDSQRDIDRALRDR